VNEGNSPAPPQLSATRLGASRSRYYDRHLIVLGRYEGCADSNVVASETAEVTRVSRLEWVESDESRSGAVPRECTKPAASDATRRAGRRM